MPQLINKNWKFMIRVATISSVIFLVGLSACSKTSPTENNIKVTASENVSLELGTPDKAIKSYWAVRDSIRSKNEVIVAQFIEQLNAVNTQIHSVMEGPITTGFTSKTTETFSRDILDVKVESESRAVIIAVIKNTTPIPAGAEMSEYAAKARRDGERYKYVLEKSKAEWKVSEIWDWRDYNNGWTKSYPSDSKPSVMTQTYEAK